MDEVSEKELFETVPAHKAVAALAIPSIISQVVSIIYNLADTFFIGIALVQSSDCAGESVWNRREQPDFAPAWFRTAQGSETGCSVQSLRRHGDDFPLFHADIVLPCTAAAFFGRKR